MGGLLTTAVTTMNTAKSQAELASKNMARQADPNANRHEAQVITQVVDGNFGGTRLAPHKAVFSEEAHIKLRETNGTHGLYQAESEYLTKLQSKYGSPGDNNSLSDLMSSMKNAFSSITTTPSDSSHRRDLLFAAKNLTNDVRGLSKEIQNLRVQADNEIATVVEKINEQLRIISETNSEVGMTNPQTTSIATQVDTRLAALKELSKYVDFTILGGKNERIIVKLSDGTTLVPETGESATISYVPKGIITATDNYPVGFNQIQVTFAGVTKDATTLVGSGRLTGLIKVRDDILPKRQAELDEYAVMLRDKLNAVHNKGTGFPPPQILTGTRQFADPSTDMINFTGTIRVARVHGKTAGVPNPNGTFNDHVDIGPQNITIEQFRDLINFSTIGVTASINGSGQLVLDSGDPDYGVCLASISTPEATVTATGQGVSDFFGLNDFFVTGNNFNGDGVKVGLSSTIDIRSDISSDPTLIASYMLEAGAAPAPGDLAIGGGVAQNALAMVQFFDSTFSYTVAGDLPGMTVTPSAYASSVLNSVSTKISQAKAQVTRSETTAKTLIDLEKRVSGIDPQAEMVSLILAQQNFVLGAQMAKTAREMMDVLLSIKSR